MGVLVVLALMCAVWAITASILIARDLDRRGVPVSILWLRVMILKYLHEYAKVTQEETGRVGPLFYHYVVPLNVALVLVIILAITFW
jgi:hypothetical protein